MTTYLDDCRFSAISEYNLATTAPLLQKLLKEAIRVAPKHLDFAVTCGHRDERAQNEAYAKGTSTKRWPNSKHNQMPSLAVDIRPALPFEAKDWQDKIRFGRIIGFIECVAAELGIKIRCGLDWDMDGRSIDETFPDLPHIELA